MLAVRGKEMTGAVLPILEVENLKLHFSRSQNLFGWKKEVIRAVDGVEFKIEEGETLVVVGESGSGKTTLGRTIVGLLEPTGGQIIYKGAQLNFSDSNRKEMRRRIQMIFQDSYSSLNPRKTIYQALSVPLRLYHPDLEQEEVEARVLKMLETIDLRPAEQYLYRYPHELSGGQRQRVCIMRAMVPEPDLVVADEPVSALDVSIRSQILTLLKEFQKKRNLTYIFITHDLSVIRSIGDDVVVMYCGRVMEQAGVKRLYAEPMHPYTRAFLAAIPNPDPNSRGEKMVLKGDPPSPIHPPPGCRFSTRCPQVSARCRREEPSQIDMGNRHLVRCHLYH